MPKPHFDPTFNMGHVFIVLSLMTSAAGAYYGVKADVGSVKVEVETVRTDVRRVEDRVNGIAQVVVTDARQDEKIASQAEKIRDIDRRVGVIEVRTIVAK